MKKLLAIFFSSILGMAVFATPLSLARQQSGSAQSPAPEKQSAPPVDNKQNETSKGGAAETDKATQKEKDDIVRISVTLVQVDAVVLDDKGRHVSDLKPEDFEITEDGRKQHITNFSYVEGQPTTPPVSAGEVAKGNKNVPPAPPMRLRPEQVKRTMAVVVDDLSLSFESTANIHTALKKFVNEQMQPGDLVAIIRTGAGMGALQQFTTDKRLLNAAIDRIRWNPMGRGGISAFAPVGASLATSLQGNNSSNGLPGVNGNSTTNTPGSKNSQEANDTLDRFREDLFAVGTLGALNYVVRGLRDLPGRKSIVVLSDGFSIFSREHSEQNQRVVDAVRRLTDFANRASVVIYTIDARGLQYLGLTAADNTSGMSNNDVQDQMEARRNDYIDTQGGLSYLAAQTGGFFIHDSNDLNKGIRRVLDDQQGYYLIGYVPEAASFRPLRGVTPFHKIHINVKRAGLHIRSRTGFFGYSDESLQPMHRTPAQQVYAALTSPFVSGDIHLKLTSLFVHDAKVGAFMHSMLYIAPNEISFTKEADGQHKAVIDVVAFTFGDNGQVIDRESREYAIRLPEEVYQKVMRAGLIYNVNVPIKKPGAYQMRVAVRDASSEKIGSANQFIEVPDIGKKRLALSGIIAQGIDPTKKDAQAIQQGVDTKEGAVEANDPQSSPSLRILHPGMRLDYKFAIYNAAVTKDITRPQLEAQVILLRDGHPVYTGKPEQVGLGALTAYQQVIAGGSLQLGSKIEPGDYVLQVIVTDRLAKEKYNTTTQWIDFEIVK